VPVSSHAASSTSAGSRFCSPSVPPRIIRAVGSDLLIALAGGAIGAVVAGLGFVAVRLSAVPGDVAVHDRRAAALDQDLERWVADDHRRLRQELSRIRNTLAAKGQLHSGAMLDSLAYAKTGALQRYRDRRSESERALADLIAEEGWPHERWRRLRKLPRRSSSTPRTGSSP
jgi:hypothetical protein